MPGGVEGGRACSDYPAHACRCMPAIGMVSLDTVGRVWGAGRARDVPKLISSRGANALKTCLRWAVRARMGMLPPHLNGPRCSFACPLGCAMPGGRSGGCESVLIHRFHPWHTVRAYACHTAALLQLGKRQPRPRTLRDWNPERSQTSLLLEAHLNN